jgi:hypothetical protein
MDERQALLRSRFRSATFTRLIADLMFGTAKDPLLKTKG